MMSLTKVLFTSVGTKEQRLKYQMSFNSHVTINHSQINHLCVHAKLAVGANENLCSIANFKTSTQIPSQNLPSKAESKIPFFAAALISLRWRQANIQM